VEFDTDLQVTVIHVVIGAIVGFISIYLPNNFLVLGVALLILLATTQAVRFGYGIKTGEKTVKGEEYGNKWWLIHSVYPFVLFWLFFWIIFYNIF